MENLLLATLTFAVNSVNEIKEIKLPSHPRLLFNLDGIAQLKERINCNDWARARWDEIRRNSDQLLTDFIELPPRGGNWWHWYACPKHGAALRTGKQIGEWQWEHICPVDGEVLSSDPTSPDQDYDGCVLMGTHGKLARSTLELGLTYQITGDKHYAEKAKEILLAYAERYLTYTLHTTRGEAKIGGGRVGPQTLDESVWLITFCQGADLVWETLKENDRTTIAQKLLLPAARDVILPHTMGVHNIQCWKNSAVGLVGFLLGEVELISEAIDNPERGYWTQMRQGVLPDGIWWEGAWGYHFYTLSALWSLTEAARNCDVNLYGDELKGMFDAPLKFSMPNLHLPAFNDSSEVNLRGSASHYELAFARYHEQRYVNLLMTGNRQNDFALWFGASELPDAPSTQWQSSNYRRSGYAILARGEGEQATWLCLKYGPHGGGHGHPDKLNFVLHARGQVVASDPGTARYGLPIQRDWYRTTLAHNTLTVGETSQKSAEGKCIAFGNKDGVDFVIADAGDIYDGVQFVRTIVLVNENLLMFIDQIRCDQEHLLDIAYHNSGVWDTLPDGISWTPPDKDGYRHLRDATIRKVNGSSTLNALMNDKQTIAITLAGGEPTEIITGTGVGNHLEDRVPIALFRCRAKAMALAWCIALDGVPAEIELLQVRDAKGDVISPSVAAAVQLTAADGQSWNFVTNPEKRSLHIQFPDGSECNTDAVFAM